MKIAMVLSFCCAVIKKTREEVLKDSYYISNCIKINFNLFLKLHLLLTNCFRLHTSYFSYMIAIAIVEVKIISTSTRFRH